MVGGVRMMGIREDYWVGRWSEWVSGCKIIRSV